MRNRKPHSEETKQKMRLKKLGGKASKETRLKMSESQKNRINKFGIHHSEETKLKIKIAHIDENVGYFGIHQWLKRKFGFPEKCVNPLCKKKSNIFEYCLREGFEHKRNRSHYTRLCRSCHRIYDKININNYLKK